MKILLLLCILSFAGLSLAGAPLYPRGCIFRNGQCLRECEVGTHSYNSHRGYFWPEPTCDNPNPDTDKRSRIRNFSACYCDAPTVRNTVTKKCVPLDECPK